MHGSRSKNPLRFSRIRRSRISPGEAEIHLKMCRVHNACSVGKVRRSFTGSHSVSAGAILFPTEASWCHFVIFFLFVLPTLKLVKSALKLVKSTLKLEKSTLMSIKSTLKLVKSTLMSVKSTLKLILPTLKLILLTLKS